MYDLPPPPVTIVVPGAVRAELLAVRDPAVRQAIPPRWVGLAAVAVLTAGFVQVAAYDPPAVLAPVPQPITGVTVAAVDAGLEGGPLLERFGLLVQVSRPRGRGDSASPSVQDEVTLLAVTGHGFFIELDGAALPALIGPTDRRGARVDFGARAQVSDCAIDAEAQRTLEVQVRQGPRTGAVKVAVAGEVVRLLDRLVARTCRRPRG
ncbi:MAG: hypothetical protein H7323_11125 [Frankiales bacterium]|nr:hypothetical protein [Frankiales bacterium]